MPDANRKEPKTLSLFIEANPHATADEIREFAAKHNVSITFSGPSQWDAKRP